MRENGLSQYFEMKDFGQPLCVISIAISEIDHKES